MLDSRHKSTHVHYQLVCPPDRYKELDYKKVEDIISIVLYHIHKDLPGTKVANWYAQL